MQTAQQIRQIELELLLEAIQKRYGWNFSHYKRASLLRSVERMLSKMNLAHISDLVPRVVWNERMMQEILCGFSIPVSEMFRDPAVFLAIRTQMIPVLKTYPFIKVWHAGCATGEEVYSLAILLHEEGLYKRARIYGTDMNPRALEKAKEGIFNEEKLEEFSKNYYKAGGQSSFQSYFHNQYGAFIINSSLKKNISFFNHNLAVDQSFGEVHLILCRNVLIYFDVALQAQVIKLFDESLCPGGFLCLGSKESLDFLNIETHFKVWLKKEKIYRKEYSEDGNHEWINEKTKALISG